MQKKKKIWAFICYLRKELREKRNSTTFPHPFWRWASDYVLPSKQAYSELKANLSARLKLCIIICTHPFKCVCVRRAFEYTVTFVCVRESVSVCALVDVLMYECRIMLMVVSCDVVGYITCGISMLCLVGDG